MATVQICHTKGVAAPERPKCCECIAEKEGHAPLMTDGEPESVTGIFFQMKEEDMENVIVKRKVDVKKLTQHERVVFARARRMSMSVEQYARQMGCKNIENLLGML